MRNKIRKWVVVIVGLYIVIGAALYFLQDKLLLHPTPLAANYQFHFQQAFTEINQPYDHTTSFNIIRFAAQGLVHRGAVIYFHGNMENINHYAAYAPNFTKNGYDVWMMDYPGYGKSTGPLNEEILYTEALQVYKMVRGAGYATDSIIIYGKSLGTGVAAQLASIRDCKKLILECPYYSIEHLAGSYAWMYPVSWILQYHLPTFQYLQKVTAPVIIFHGTEDGTVPFSNSLLLQSTAFKKGDTLFPVNGADHNTIFNVAQARQLLDSVLMQ